MASDNIKQQISNATDAKIQELINEGMESEEVQKKLAEAEEGAKAVIALKTSLDKYNAFYLGVLAYTSAVDSATAGAKELAQGASELEDGSAQLASGAADLYDGASKLYDGMNTFDKEGIDKMLSSLDESGVKELFDRFSALVDVTGRDSLIGGIADGMNGESRIIVKTGKIAANN
jgi:putative membrane protein